MSNIFSMEGKLFSGLEKMANLILLNFLFMICCIPIVTAGAATTALFYVTMKMYKNEEGYIIRSYLKSFRQNFKQATIIWVAALVLGILFFVDIRIVLEMQSTFGKVLLVLFTMLGMVYLFIMTYIFPLLSKFDNTVKNTVKNALLISIRHLPFTLLLIVMILAPVAAAVFVPFLFMLVFLIGFAFIAFYTSGIYLNIMKHYLPPEEDEEPAEF